MKKIYPPPAVADRGRAPLADVPRTVASRSQPHRSTPSEDLVGHVPFNEAKKRFIKRYLTELVEACGFNVTKAARFAQVDQRFFRRLLKKYDVPTKKHPWNGLCPANQHGLDYEGQPCDLCHPKLLLDERHRLPFAKAHEHELKQGGTTVPNEPGHTLVVGVPTAMDNLRSRAPRMEHVTRGPERREAYVPQKATPAQDLARANRLRASVRNECHANSEGDCNWKQCPQLRDGEPEKSRRTCPLYHPPEDV